MTEPLKSYADPEANKEIQRLRAKVARVEALSKHWRRWPYEYLVRCCGHALKRALAEPEDRS